MLPRLNWLDSAQLWLVLDRAASAPRSLADVTRECIAGGVDAVVFRARELSAAQALPPATEVREICAQSGVPFVLSHFLVLAAELRPDALHLGVADRQAYYSLDGVRRRLPAGTALGGSVHSIAELLQVFGTGADYAFLGPIFATPSKLKYGQPLGVGVVGQAAALPRPVVFIGGVNAETLPQVMAAGGSRIAAISALQSVEDPRGATARLKRRLSTT